MMATVNANAGENNQRVLAERDLPRGVSGLLHAILEHPKQKTQQNKLPAKARQGQKQCTMKTLVKVETNANGKGNSGKGGKCNHGRSRRVISL